MINRISDKILKLKNKLNKSAKKLNSMKSLINQNKNQPIPKDKLEFPFLVVSTLDHESNNVSMKFNSDRSNLKI